MTLPPKVHPKSAKADVIAWMNWSIGEKYWDEHNGRWKNLLTVRNEFIANRLHDQLLSIHDYKALPKESKRYFVNRIAISFSDGTFFQYTRDEMWQRDAVSEQDDWTRIDGVAPWHIKWGLSALVSGAKEKAITGASPSNASAST